MALILSLSDPATRTLDRNATAIPSANGNEHPGGHEAKWTWKRTPQTPVANRRQANGQSGTLSVERDLCRTPSRITNGREAITRLDAADMARLCRDEDEAMTCLMRRHAHRLHGVIARMLKDWNEAADVVDEAFIRVYRHRHRFDLQARFTTWLYTIAFNLARNRLRHRARQPELIPLEELNEDELESQQCVPIREPTPDVHLEHAEEMRGLEDSLAALPPQLCVPVRLFAYDELSQNQIGSLLHCSAKAVESRLYHARKQLRADFERFLHPRISVCPFKPQHKIEIKT